MHSDKLSCGSFSLLVPNTTPIIDSQFLPSLSLNAHAKKNELSYASCPALLRPDVIDCQSFLPISHNFSRTRAARVNGLSLNACTRTATRILEPSTAWPQRTHANHPLSSYALSAQIQLPPVIRFQSSQMRWMGKTIFLGTPRWYWGKAWKDWRWTLWENVN